MDIDSKLNKLDIKSGDEASSSTQVQVDSKVYYVILYWLLKHLPFLSFIFFSCLFLYNHCRYLRIDSHYDAAVQWKSVSRTWILFFPFPQLMTWIENLLLFLVFFLAFFGSAVTKDKTSLVFCFLKNCLWYWFLIAWFWFEGNCWRQGWISWLNE